MSVRILIVDDHPLVRAGFQLLAETRPEVELVAEADRAATAVDAARRHRPDVVVMDLELPDGSGIDATRQIRSDNPRVRVLVLTMHEDEDAVLAALRAGANGYILKGAHQDDIVRAILGAAAGELILGPTVAAVVTGRIDELGTTRKAFTGLTVREHEVLELLASGQPNGKIATALGISRKTVANHLANILTKLPAVDRGEAIAKARAAGYGKESG